MEELIKKESVKNTITTNEISEMMEVKHYKILEKLEGTKDGKTKGIIPTLTNNNIYVEDFFIKSSYKDVKGQNRKSYLCTLNGVKLIINSTRNYSKKEKLLNWYESKTNKDIFILKDRDENTFINKLKNSFSFFNITDGKAQYSVDNLNGSKYYIDYYIPSLNIAIEYDENDHANYTYEQHEGRQAYIENKLGCNFIRVSDKASDEYNISLVLDKLFKMELIV